MPVWVPELDLLYVLVPRTGSTAFRRHLRLEYGAVDLTAPAAIESGLVRPDNHLSKHSDFAQLGLDFLPPVPRRKIARLAGVRHPADNLFSAWWKYAFVYPKRLENLNELPEPDQRFLSSDTTRRRIEDIGSLTFSEWVLAAVPPPLSRAARTREQVERKLRLGRAHRSAHRQAPKRLQELWYEGADVYLRFEQVSADWERTCRERGWSYRGAIPMFNETEGRPTDYTPYLNERAADRLRQTYKREIARFGYEIRSGAPD